MLHFARYRAIVLPHSILSDARLDAKADTIWMYLNSAWRYLFSRDVTLNRSERDAFSIMISSHPILLVNL